MKLFCWLFGHRYVPLNDHNQLRVFACMRCADAWEFNLFAAVKHRVIHTETVRAQPGCTK